MTGWTSWYNYYQNINEAIIIENLNNFKNLNNLGNLNNAGNLDNIQYGNPYKLDNFLTQDAALQE